MTDAPGRLVLFGSGETLTASGKAHEYIAAGLNGRPRIAILETPAGFEPNSPRVAGAVGDFLARRLQNYSPKIHIIPARKKGETLGPDNPAILEPLLAANWVFMGPGSPTYAVRNLQGTLAYEFLRAKHRLGTDITFASAAVLAVSRFTLPIYEIYKVGEDLHWKDGLNLFGDYGLDLICVPHWNNSDGGDELDTSHCYIGKARFQHLVELLPNPRPVILGIDEHTSLAIDFARTICKVMGKGSVTIDRQGHISVFAAGKTFHLSELGDFHLPSGPAGIRPAAWQAAIDFHHLAPAASPAAPSEVVTAWVQQREDARAQRQWLLADELRKQILSAGWKVNDTPDGPELTPLD